MGWSRQSRRESLKIKIVPSRRPGGADGGDARPLVCRRPARCPGGQQAGAELRLRHDPEARGRLRRVWDGWRGMRREGRDHDRHCRRICDRRYGHCSHEQPLSGLGADARRRQPDLAAAWRVAAPATARSGGPSGMSEGLVLQIGWVITTI